MKQNNILIKNIYYMLAYVYCDLNKKQYACLAVENFEDIEDLLTSILIKGVNYQLKKGLYTDYQEKEDLLLVVRGKIVLQKTLNQLNTGKKQIYCQFDGLSYDNIFNRIIKATMILLLKDTKIKEEYKIIIKKYLRYFSKVEYIDLVNIKWKQLKNYYHRNNMSYELLMNICYLIYDRHILSDKQGDNYLWNFIDDINMANLYEKFVLNYYKKHYPELKAKSEVISWNVNSMNSDDEALAFLPRMRTDITLTYANKILIIDTKFYQYSLVKHSRYQNSHLKHHSDNLYQIFTYVKNKDKINTGNVKGLLLYAQTVKDGEIRHKYMMAGNEFYVQTLNLNQDFARIKAQLDDIVNLIKDKKAL